MAEKVKTEEAGSRKKEGKSGVSPGDKTKEKRWLLFRVGRNKKIEIKGSV